MVEAKDSDFKDKNGNKILDKGYVKEEAAKIKKPSKKEKKLEAKIAKLTKKKHTVHENLISTQDENQKLVNAKNKILQKKIEKKFKKINKKINKHAMKVLKLQETQN